MKHRLYPIPMAVQMARLKQAYPNSQATLKRDVLCWVADLTPTALSRTYRIKLEMHKDGTPAVRLVQPTLQTRDGKRCPHLYPEGVLCLYLPGAFEWTKEMQLVETIVPWISEWLAHYEVWLSTGVWTGGGAHPDTKDPKVRHHVARRAASPSVTMAAARPTDAASPETVLKPVAIADFVNASAPVVGAGSEDSSSE